MSEARESPPYAVPRRDLPEFLYHYTDIHGVEGILDSRRLLASHVRFLNDSKEPQYGLGKVREQVEKAGAVDRIGSLLSGGFDGYVFCATTEGDDIGQWRAYCPNGGYSICFDHGLLAGNAAAARFTIQKCIYEEEDQEDLASQWVQLALDGYRRGDQYLRALSVTRHVDYFCARFKDPALRQEREWRMVNAPTEGGAVPTGWKVRGPLAVPVLEVRLGGAPPFSIAKIIVGPQPHQDLAAEGLEKLLSVVGVSGHKIEVEKSKIPYRPVG